jgi:hypothetical protein
VYRSPFIALVMCSLRFRPLSGSSSRVADSEPQPGTPREGNRSCKKLPASKKMREFQQIKRP